MRVGLIDVDGHNFPNLCLMKLAAWHKAQGDSVEWHNALIHYDRVYMSRVFDDTYSKDIDYPVDADEIIKGGTGYAINGTLPPEIEHIMPDYSLYNITDTAFGYLSRGCPRGCSFCIVAEKEGRRSHKVADLSEWWGGQKFIELMDPNITACADRLELVDQLADSRAYVNINQGLDARFFDEEFITRLNRVKTKRIHMAFDDIRQEAAVIRGLELYNKYGKIHDHGRRVVYVLVNYGSTMEENLYRIYKCRELDFDPFVMIYDKPHAPKEIKRLARWVNNRFIWRSCEKFEDYNG